MRSLRSSSSRNVRDVRDRNYGTLTAFLIALLAACSFSVAGAPAHVHDGIAHVHLTSVDETPDPVAPHHPGEYYSQDSQGAPGSRYASRDLGPDPVGTDPADALPLQVPADRPTLWGGPAPPLRAATTAQSVLCLWRI